METPLAPPHGPQAPWAAEALPDVSQFGDPAIPTFGEDGDVKQQRYGNICYTKLTYGNLHFFFGDLSQFRELQQHCTTFPDHVLKYCRCSIPSGNLHNYGKSPCY